MNKGKLIPLIIGIFLVILAIILFIRMQKNKVAFTKLTITYKGVETEYTDIKIENVIVINNVSFWVNSTMKNSIVLTSSDMLLKDNKKEANEFTFKLGKVQRVCFADNDCASFILS